MDNLLEIIKNRATPGVLIFDMSNALLYSNSEALAMLSGFQGRTVTKGKKQQVPEEIYALCKTVKREADEKRPPSADNPNCKVLYSETGLTYSVRAFCMGFQSGYSDPTHIMVLLENIVEKRRVDYNKVRDNFKLTQKETEVLKLLCDGLPNREISRHMSITEYTVKDHIKKIMQKMNAASRSEIITSAFQR